MLVRRLDTPLGPRRRARRPRARVRAHPARRQAAAGHDLRRSGNRQDPPRDRGRKRLRPDATVLVGRCTEHGGATYAPLREVVTAAVGGTTDGLHALMDGEPNGELVAARMADALGAGSAPAPWKRRRGRYAVCSSGWRATGRSCSSWRMSTGLPRACSTSSSTSSTWAARPSSSSASARGELLDTRPGWPGGTVNSSSLVLGALSTDEATGCSTSSSKASLSSQAIERGSSASPTAIPCTSSSSSPRPATRPPTACRTRSGSPRRPAGRPPLGRARGARRGGGVRGHVLGCRSLRARRARGAPAAGRARAPRPPSPGGRTALRGGDAHLRPRAHPRRLVRQRSQAPPGRPPPGSRQRLARVEAERGLELDELVGFHLERAAQLRADVGDEGAELRGLSQEAARGSQGGNAGVERDERGAVRSLLTRAVALFGDDDAERATRCSRSPTRCTGRPSRRRRRRS